jgi:CheY-like chemotaxis protein
MGNENTTLLVVDDTELNRKLLRRRLGSSGGYRVLVAESGAQALEILEDQTVDLMILDIMMPGMSGIEVLSRLREQQATKNLPVIIASSKAESDDMVEALDAGANDYVTKPFDFPVLLARIKTQLRGSKMRKRETVPTEIGTGSILEERYRLDSMIGVGSFGAVFRGTHLGLDNPVAVKVLQAARGNSPEACRKLRQDSPGLVGQRFELRGQAFRSSEHHATYLSLSLLCIRADAGKHEWQ